MRPSALPLLLALAPVAVSAQEANPLAGRQLAQVTIHEHISIRIRTRPPLATPANVRPVWSEKKADQCVPVARLAGAALSGGGDVDLLLIDGNRLRAKLAEDCPSLDFYAGFYLKKTADGRICAKRDVLRARSGAACPISRFRRLEVRK